MIPAEEELLRQIRAEPDADGPRLVYADWCIEHGDPRGELVAIQCELESELTPERRAELVQRSVALQPKQPELAFRYQLPVDTLVFGELGAWSRGFAPAYRVSSIVETFDAQKDELYRLAPCASVLRLWASGHSAPWREVLADPAAARWGAVWGVPSVHIPHVAEQAHLDALRELSIEMPEDPELTVLDPLFDAERFPVLESLEIAGQTIDGQLPGLPPLPAETWRRAAFAGTLRAFEGEMLDTLDVFPNLESFSAFFYNDNLDPIVGFGGQLRSLKLGFEDTPLMMDELRALLAAPCLRTLETLVLNLHQRTSHAATAWSGLDRMPSLRSLRIRGPVVDNELVNAIADGPALVGLRTLQLGGTSAGGTIVRRLVADRTWPDLEVLDLGTMPHSTEILADILAAMPKLTQLHCGATDVEVLNLEAIRRLEVLELHVEGLRLPSTIGDELKLLQLQFPWRDPHNAVRAEAWGRDHGFDVLRTYSGLRSRGRDAVTLARLRPGFWSWAARSTAT